MQSQSDKTYISFIIPAYNSEKTIGRAVKSIGSSDDVEILVVENGCTDQTEKLVQTMASKDSRIRLLHSEKGVSRARNEGLNQARGEWIAFLDADDYLTDDATNTMLTCAKDGVADLYLFGHYAGETKRRPVSSSTEILQDDVYTEGIVRMLKNPTQYMQVWAKLFRGDIIREAHLRFDTELTLAEDSDFTLRYALQAKSMCFSEKVLYQYTLNPQSVMRSGSKSKADAYETAMSRTKTCLEQAPEAVKDAYSKYCLMHFNIAMVRETFAYGSQKSLKESLTEMKDVAGRPIFREAFNGVRQGECRSLRMLPILFIKCKMYLPAAWIYKTRAAMNYKNEQKARVNG